MIKPENETLLINDPSQVKTFPLRRNMLVKNAKKKKHLKGTGMSSYERALVSFVPAERYQKTCTVTDR